MTATINSIRGNTVVWNQLNNNSSSYNGVTGVTKIYNNDGSVTLNGTATVNGSMYFRSNITGLASHKVLIKGCPQDGGSDTY